MLGPQMIQEDVMADESSDEGTPRVKEVPRVTLRGCCTRHRELGCVMGPWWWVVVGGSLKLHN